MRRCTVPGCDRGHYGLGYCELHYKRVKARGTTDLHDPHAADDRAVAYYTGAADARNHRPRRVDHADTSIIGQAYTRGYTAQRIANAAHWLSPFPKAAVYPQDRR